MTCSFWLQFGSCSSSILLTNIAHLPAQRCLTVAMQYFSLFWGNKRQNIELGIKKQMALWSGAHNENFFIDISSQIVSLVTGRDSYIFACIP